MRLKNKTAVITGGAGGLGIAIAKRFLEEGANVIITDIIEEKITRTVFELTPIGNISGCKMDVTDAKQVQDVIAEIVATHEKIDILINNAGISSDAQLIKMSEEQFDKVVAVNLKGVFLCARAVVPYMIKEGYGKIVNNSSVTALYGGFGITNYAATKAGVIAMTKTWAKEYARKGLNINAVAPGYTLTDMVKSLPEKILDSLNEKTPMKRLAQPKEIAEAFLYLASDESSYVSGAVLSVDGGITL